MRAGPDLADLEHPRSPAPCGWSLLTLEPHSLNPRLRLKAMQGGGGGCGVAGRLYFFCCFNGRSQERHFPAPPPQKWPPVESVGKENVKTCLETGPQLLFS